MWSTLSAKAKQYLDQKNVRLRLNQLHLTDLAAVVLTFLRQATGVPYNITFQDYVYAGEGPEGHWNYEQAQNNQFGEKDKLYFFPYLQAWYIGNKFDVNMGFAYNQQTTQCPEDLDHGWQWTDGEQWIDDPQAKFTCAEVIPPIPDFCVSGSMCNDCSLTAGYQGVTYCCNNDCNYGWINVDPTTNPLCQCGHE